MSSDNLLPPLVIPTEDEGSFIPTPVLSQMLASFGSSTTVLGAEEVTSLDQTPSDATSHISPKSNHIRLPVPKPLVNSSQTSFTFIEVSGGDAEGDFGALLPEVLSADISIARECPTFSSRAQLPLGLLVRRDPPRCMPSSSLQPTYSVTGIDTSDRSYLFRFQSPGCSYLLTR